MARRSLQVEFMPDSAVVEVRDAVTLPEGVPEERKAE